MPIKIVSVADITHDEWLEYRRKGIGGSDAATIVGLNPYNSLFALYADKIGKLPPKEDTEVMRQGRDFEEYVAKRFCEATGKKVRRRNYMFRSDEHEFMQADVDREIIGENAGLECKTTSVYNKSDFENGEIPLYYYVQMTHYMAVMGYDRMYLAVLVLSKAFHWFVVERDEDEIKSLVSAEKRFWYENVLEHVAPPVDGSEATTEAVKAIYSNDTYTDFTADIKDEIMSEYETAKELADKADERLKAVKNRISCEMQENGYGVSSDYKISWLPQSRTTIDNKRLRADHPEIFEQYSKTSTSRVLRINKIKKAED